MKKKILNYRSVALVLLTASAFAVGSCGKDDDNKQKGKDGLPVMPDYDKLTPEQKTALEGEVTRNGKFVTKAAHESTIKTINENNTKLTNEKNTAEKKYSDTNELLITANKDLDLSNPSGKLAIATNTIGTQNTNITDLQNKVVNARTKINLSFTVKTHAEIIANDDTTGANAPPALAISTLFDMAGGGHFAADELAALKNPADCPIADLISALNKLSAAITVGNRTENRIIAELGGFVLFTKGADEAAASSAMFTNAGFAANTAGVNVIVTAGVNCIGFGRLPSTPLSVLPKLTFVNTADAHNAGGMEQRYKIAAAMIEVQLSERIRASIAELN